MDVLEPDDKTGASGRFFVYILPFAFAASLARWGEQTPEWLVILLIAVTALSAVAAASLWVKNTGGLQRLKTRPALYLPIVIVLSLLVGGSVVYVTVKRSLRGAAQPQGSTSSTTQQPASPSTPAPQDATPAVPLPSITTRPKALKPHVPSHRGTPNSAQTKSAGRGVSPNLTPGDKPAYAREPVAICPAGYPVILLEDESAMSDNGGCAATFTTPAACIILRGHSYIQRNTGGGVCHVQDRPQASAPNGWLMNGLGLGNSRSPIGDCSTRLNNVIVEGFHTGVDVLGDCLTLSKSTLEHNGTGVDMHQPSKP